MTIASLWLPSLGPTTVSSVPSLANTTLYNTGSSSGTDVVTFASSYSTALNDCIIVAYWGHVGPDSFTFSGSGATWTSYAADATNTPGCGIAVGYAATASNTTITATSGSSGNPVNMVVSVWKNIAATTPVTDHQIATSGAGTAASITTPSLTYAAGQLVVGSGGVGTAGFGATTWSNGSTDISIGVENQVNLSYILPVSGTATTLTENTSSSTHNIRATAVALSHA